MADIIVEHDRAPRQKGTGRCLVLETENISQPHDSAPVVVTKEPGLILAACRTG